ncbi:MAG: AI-2E family transporter, partial [Bosea sp. 12-68-7]
LVQVQVDRVSTWLEAHGVNLGMSDLRSAAQQLMGSIGRVTAAVGSAIGVFSSLVLMLVLAIFLAAEPGTYARGSAWLLPIGKREAALSLLDKMGSALRRLMAGRLLGMAVEGVGTWLLLLVGGVPMAALLGVLTGILAFLPNIGAIISGALIILVGFSAGTEIGIYAIVVYLAVQMIDGYLIVPMVARRAVDLPPALVLAAQILFGTLFGILGLFLADSVLAMAKVFLEERAQRREQESAGKEGT